MGEPLEALDSAFSTTATAPTAITMPTTIAMIRRDTGRSSSGTRWLDLSGRGKQLASNLVKL